MTTAAQVNLPVTTDLLKVLHAVREWCDMGMDADSFRFLMNETCVWWHPDQSQLIPDFLTDGFRKDWWKNGLLLTLWPFPHFPRMGKPLRLWERYFESYQSTPWLKSLTGGYVSGVSGESTMLFLWCEDYHDAARFRNPLSRVVEREHLTVPHGFSCLTRTPEPA